MKSHQATVVTSDAEIDAAIAVAKVREPFRPKAVAVTFRVLDDMLVVRLATGVVLNVPRRLLQGLEGAKDAELTKVEILEPGDSLHWESLDVDHYLPNLIDGIFGNRRWMSEIRKAGSVTTA